MDPATILLIVRGMQQFTLLSLSLVQAIESIKNGDPDKVDLDELRQQLLQLPDLPVLNGIEDSLVKEIKQREQKKVNPVER